MQSAPRFCALRARAASIRIWRIARAAIPITWARVCQSWARSFRSRR